MFSPPSTLQSKFIWQLQDNGEQTLQSAPVSRDQNTLPPLPLVTDLYIRPHPPSTSLTLKMVTVMYAKTMNNFKHMIWLNTLLCLKFDSSNLLMTYIGTSIVYWGASSFSEYLYHKALVFCLFKSKYAIQKNCGYGVTTILTLNVSCT